MRVYFFILCAMFLPRGVYASSVDEKVNLPVVKMYQLGNDFEKLIAQGKEDEDVRKELKKLIGRIATGDLLTRWMQFIDQTSTRSSIYRTVFESMTPQGALKVISVNVTKGEAVVTLKIHVSELYAPSTDMITLEELFSKYKIINLSIAEVITLLPTTPLADLVEYQIKSERRDEVYLKNLKGIWKIEKIKQNIISSNIDVVLPKAPK